MGVKLRGFYTPSLPRLVYNEEKGKYDVDAESEAGDKEAHWMYLFVDLVLIALIAKISAAVAQCELSTHTLTFQCVLFITMFMTRLHMDDYTTRFFSNDVFHRFFYFVYIMSFFIMALNVNVADSNHTHSDALCHANLYSYGFGIGFLTSRFSLIVLYLSVMMEDARAFEQFFSCVARTALAVFLVVVFLWYEQAQLAQGDKGAFVPSYRMYIYLVACFVEWGGMTLHSVLLGLKKNGHAIHPVFLGMEYFPINVDRLQERLGAFILMVLGEAIIMICVPYFDVNNPTDTYTFNIVACLIIWCYGVMYFDACAGQVESDHAMQHSLLTAYLYTWLHLFLGLSMFYTSSMIGMLYGDVVNTSQVTVQLDLPPEDDASKKQQWNHVRICRPETLLAWSVAITIIFFALMRMLHANQGRGMLRIFDCTCSSRGVISDQVGLIWRLGCAVFHLTVPSYQMPRPSMNAGVHMVLLIVMLVLETEIGGKPSMGDKMFEQALEAKLKREGKSLADMEDHDDSTAAPSPNGRSKTNSSLPARHQDVEFGEGASESHDEGGTGDFGYDDAFRSSSAFKVSASSAMAMGAYPLPDALPQGTAGSPQSSSARRSLSKARRSSSKRI